MAQNEQIQNFLQQSLEFAELLQSKKDEIIRLLTTYETYETATDEINRSIRTIHGFEKEFSSIERPLKDLNFSTFFPLNLPLYSLVIFGIAPSAFAHNVFIRPPEVMQEILEKIWDALDVGAHFPELTLKPTPRHIFMELYASESEVIIFTGKYENALAIHKKCPDSLLIYNGSGVNPFVVFENANINLAVAKAVEMRCFNSGQDCAGPDAFFVPSSLVDEFTKKLKQHLEHVKVGPPSDFSNQVGYTIKTTYIDQLSAWLKDHHDELIFGGKIEKEKHLVHPAIIKRQITVDDTEEFHEFFAPFFYILEYKSEVDLIRILQTKPFQERAMYVSAFGSNQEVESKLTLVRLLRNKIVNDVEIGNEEYGGYGPHANFLLYHGKKFDHPVLISRDLHQLLVEQEAPTNDSFRSSDQR